MQNYLNANARRFIPNALYCSCPFLGYNWDVFGPVKTCTFTQIHRLIYVCSIVDIVQGQIANSLVHSPRYRLFMTYRRQYYFTYCKPNLSTLTFRFYNSDRFQQRIYLKIKRKNTHVMWPHECSLNMFSPEIENLHCPLKIRTHHRRLFFVCYVNVMFGKKSHYCGIKTVCRPYVWLVLKVYSYWIIRT